MKKTLQEKSTFTKIDYSGMTLSDIEFDSCAFIHCNFTKSDLSSSDFPDCSFKECDFSMVRLNNTGFKNVIFSGSKLLGIDFTKCKDFLLAFSFDRCTLDYSTFSKKKIRHTIFKDCTIREADFSETDLTGSSFLNCDLSRTIFMHTILEKVDFRSATNYTFDLELNRVKKAKFSLPGIIGLLDKYQIDIG
jgi:fluoroquinolone resistance protein